jgi:hypothetical protein
LNYCWLDSNGCGPADPDCCLELDSDTYNCKFGETCSLKGTCVGYEVKDTHTAYVSEACESIFVAGAPWLGPRDDVLGDHLCRP